MKYYIQRQLSEYGPYTLADLQRYVAQGSILMTDLARSEGMTEWVPVSQVIGNIPIPVPGPPAGTFHGGVSGYETPAGSFQAGQAFPVPPDFHWGLVLLLGIVTCGLFWWAWVIVEAVWIRKIKPASKGLLMVLLSVASYFVGGFMNGLTSVMNEGHANPLGGLFSLAGFVLAIVAVFTMRSDLEDYYNSVEPIHLRLSGVMTFFFAVFYFQHHFSRIAQWKKNGVLVPQG